MLNYELQPLYWVGIEPERVNQSLVFPLVFAFKQQFEVAVALLGLETLFDHVGREFEFAQAKEVTGNKLVDLPVELSVLDLQDILHQVVSVLVLYKTGHLLDNDIRQSELLVEQSLLKTPLHDAASLLVCTDLQRILHAGIENKIGELAKLLGAGSVFIFGAFSGAELGDECLDYVVTVYVCA